MRFNPASARLAGLALACAAALTAPAAAGTSSANFSVTATVVNACLISASNLAFGTYDPTAAGNTTAFSQITLTCTVGAAPVVTIGYGLHATGTQRAMIDSASNLLNYNLYQPPSTTPGAACSYTSPTAWGTTGPTSFTPTTSPSLAARSYDVCGSIPAGQADPATSGGYTDATVVATVTF